MENVKNAILAAVATVVTFVGNVLSVLDVSLKVLLAMMAVDYITGWMVAAFWRRSNKSTTGALDSRAGFKGLCRKAAVFGLLLIANWLDVALGISYVRTAVCWFFVANEGLSLLENLGLMGVPYPKFLKNALEALKDKADEGDGHHDGV